MIKDKHRYKIMIVEDNLGDFTLVEDFLLEQILDPEIIHAQNFSECVAALNVDRDSYDVILLDLTLPDISGQRLLDEMLLLCPDCPIIVLTGYSDMEFSVKSISQGISDYLLKDELNPAMLYKSIIYCIERQRQLHQLRDSESRYSNIFHLSPQSKWLYDPETLRFIKVNNAAMELYGYDESEFMEMTILDICTQEDILRTKELSCLRGDHSEVRGGRFKHLTKHNDIIDVEIYCSPVRQFDKESCLVVAIDVTEKVRHENNITRAIIKTQEIERYEIGSELHDNVCQILATSLLNLGILRESLSDDVMKRYDECRQSIKLATREIRNISHRLAPAFYDDDSFENSVRQLLAGDNAENKYEITFHYHQENEFCHISREMELNVYRIIQEQWRNIQKHAEATQIEVSVFIGEKTLSLHISDNGKGFEEKAQSNKGIGIANMIRRAELFGGTLYLKSSLGNGCKLNVEIPLPKISA